MIHEHVSKLESLIRENDQYRSETINMIAAENVTSKTATRFFNNGFKHRYACGTPGNRSYAGCKVVDKLEPFAQEMLGKLFDCSYVNLYPIAGVVSNLISFTGLLKEGNKVAVVDPSCGSHYSHHEKGMLGCAGGKNVFLPFDTDTFNVDIIKSKEIIQREQPKMVVLGASEMLFPAPVKEIREFFDGTILYDAAHVLGLIAGRVFQDPLGEGADLISTSTHKTFFGPQGGMILTNSKEIFDKTINVSFDIVSNHHINRLPALAIAVMEMIEYGEGYAKQIVKNAKKLGQAMYDSGINVAGAPLGFTESHQIMIDASEMGENKEVVAQLEKADLITSPCPLPGDRDRETGVRFGVQEMTRLGMKEEEMEQIADFVARVLIKKEAPETVKKEVNELRSGFQNVHYSLLKILLP